MHIKDNVKTMPTVVGYRNTHCMITSTDNHLKDKTLILLTLRKITLTNNKKITYPECITLL